MKTSPIYPLLILLLLMLSEIFGVRVNAIGIDKIGHRTKTKVHALLIILGNDREIRGSVEKNESMMVRMFKQLSHDCTVNLTVMKSKNYDSGEIVSITYVNGESTERKITEQDIIESRQVTEWLENLKPESADTVLIYYSGHGEINSIGAHHLIFDPVGDTIIRKELSRELRQKPARLGMLITDTCSILSNYVLKSDRSVGIEKVERRNYSSDLFLKHDGFLDITAASTGQFAIGSPDSGGFLTNALLSYGFTATADVNDDNFLSWEETFAKTEARTKALYKQASFDADIAAELRANRQTTQVPVAYSLPKPR